MARFDQLLDLKAEVTCPICVTSLKEPVITECGHNFCASCIKQMRTTQPDAPCPKCRSASQIRNLRPNRQLGNLVWIVEQMVLTKARKVEKHLCDIHDEEPCMFCRDDQQPICSLCIQSGDHTNHTMVQIEEAASEYKNALQTTLELLKKKMEDQTELVAREKKHMRKLEVRFKTQQDPIMSEFDKLDQALEHQMQHVVISLDRQYTGILRRIREKIKQLHQERTTALNKMITELTVKCEESETEFLKDVKCTLTRCDNLSASKTETYPDQLQDDLENFQEQYNTIKHKFKKLKGKLAKSLVWSTKSPAIETVPAHLKWRDVKEFPSEVTLDPDTSFSRLLISNNRRRVIRLARGDEADNSEGFETWGCVLGQQRFSSGKHYWEVDVGRGASWRVGVCAESTNIRGRITMAPYRGFWAVGMWHGNSYFAYTSVHLTRLIPAVRLKVVGVFLDYEAGMVAFYDALEKYLIFSYPPCPLPTILRPLFYTFSTVDPLIILPRNDP